MKPCAVVGIAFGPTGNAQGGVNFFSLFLGRVLDCRKEDYDLLPMPADAIVRVEKIARRSPTGLVFGNRNTILDGDDDDEDDGPNDPTYIPSNHSVSSSSPNSNVSIITGVNDKDNDSNNNDEVEPCNEDNDNNNDTKDNANNNNNKDNNNNNDYKDNTNNNNNEDNNNNNDNEDNDNNDNNTTQTRSGCQVQRNKRDTDIYEYNHFHVDANCDIVPLSTENEYSSYIDTVKFLDGKDSPDHPDMINAWILLQ